ncbi:HTH-type transcriptional regulator Xre [Pseudomonas syringae pv. actinidiae]|uniref:helix-turn-helix domain-containing protein n=1 Tax=Pseudomonas syringae TaxID=317 RepID=UPI000A24A32C|nr:helix-turn-helix transcriptional regulator [Pseudomonas syringae]OSN67634.1 HTH-type transcriptional regulator Xre [Pseudomonas syringae pv. actinidiae]OSN67645.1 HTH-type transcriptional regulator Xre [Pseudomonas syringae pv. actinidiae]OSN68365.1 HTH-type transcriptional regulator Xre [Pseudomonas syringae pv. actinidiae]
MQALKYRNNGTGQLNSIYDLETMRNQSDRTMTLSENLKRFRKARGLTQPDVWGPAGIAKSSYTSYEAGTQMPSADKIVELAKVLGVTTDELLLGESELTVSEDLRPILKRFDSLPPEIRNQARIALKGVLFGFEQEAIK